MQVRSTNGTASTREISLLQLECRSGAHAYQSSRKRSTHGTHVKSSLCSYCWDARFCLLLWLKWNEGVIIIRNLSLDGWRKRVRSTHRARWCGRGSKGQLSMNFFLFLIFLSFFLNVFFPKGFCDFSLLFSF